MIYLPACIDALISVHPCDMVRHAVIVHNLSVASWVAMSHRTVNMAVSIIRCPSMPAMVYSKMMTMTMAMNIQFIIHRLLMTPDFYVTHAHDGGRLSPDCTHDNRTRPSTPAHP